MKALIPLAVAFLLAFSILASWGSAQFVDINVVLLNQNPLPAEPGTNMDIEVSIQNDGFEEEDGFAVEIMPTGPFSLVKGDKIKTFSRIGGKSSVTVTYTLAVDDSSLAGDYDLEFRIYSPITPGSYRTEEIEINLIGETKLTIGKVETIPETLEPGGKANIRVTIKNVGTGDARQLEGKMESSSLSLVPILSGGLVYIGELKAGEETVVDLYFNIDPDADQDTYSTTLTLTYKDEDNQLNTVEFPIGIPVEGNVRFELVTFEPQYSRGTLDIEVANKGTGDASSIEARLVVDEKTIGLDYLSSLKATKKTTFSFPLVLSGDAELVLTYVEPGLEEVTIVKEIGPINYASQGSDSTTTIIFIIVIVVIVFLAWRYFFSKKRHKG